MGKNCTACLPPNSVAPPRPWQTWEVDLMLKVANHLAGAIHQNELYHKLQIANAELERIATTDSLTQVANRLRFDSVLSPRVVSHCSESKRRCPCCCSISTTLSSTTTSTATPKGMLVWFGWLTTAREALKRPADFIARYGGEEFALHSASKLTLTTGLCRPLLYTTHWAFKTYSSGHVRPRVFPHQSRPEAL